MKFLILLLLLAIVLSLGSSLFYLTRDDQGSARMLKALKIRVALSVTLVAFLVAAYFMGWIAPTSTIPS